MRWRAAFVTAATAGCMLSSADSHACVSRLYGPNSADTLGFEAGPGVSEDWIEAGIARWDVCPEGGFPMLSCGVQGDYTFTVTLISGQSVGVGVALPIPTSTGMARHGR